MQRRSFVILPPVREIRLGDTRAPFRSDLLKTCRTDMLGLYRKNKGIRHVWVYDMEGTVASVIVFIDYSDHLYLDVITNNFAIPRSAIYGVSPGTHLYRSMQSAALAKGMRKIKLESITERVPYWRRLGFEESGSPYFGGLFMLHPMEKAL